MDKILKFQSPWDNDTGDDNIYTRRNNQAKNFLNNFNFQDSKKIILLAITAIFCVWIISGVYQIKEGQAALVIRFGKIVRVANPGLNYHIPSPIENIVVENISKSRRIEVGYRSNDKGSDTSKIIPIESIMLTGDENIVELTGDITWHINNLSDYYLHSINPEQTIKAVGESAIREIIGQKPINAILSDQKQEITNEIEILTQKILTEYNLGVQIEQIQLLKAEPPAAVIDAYRDVQSARADKEKVINQAQAYRNDAIPKARGQVVKGLQEAEAYKQTVITKATGDTKRFLSLYQAYLGHRNITQNRMRLDAINEILHNNQKFITNNSILPHMSLNPNKQAN